MNRLRLLKKRANKGGVIVHRMGGRYVAVDGGGCSAPMSKRAAIQVASRWAMPSAPRVFLVEQNNVQTVITVFPDGRCEMAERNLTSVSA